MIHPDSNEKYRGTEFEQPEALALLFADIRAANQLIEANELSDRDIQDLIIEFDARWPYMDESMTILGMFYSAKVDMEELENKGLDSFRVTSLEKDCVPGGSQVTSKGFNILRDDERIRIGHFFQTNSFPIQVSRFQLVHSFLFGIADIDEVQVIPDRKTQEFRDARARYYYPDIMNNIDERVFSANSFEESIKELAKIQIPNAREYDYEELEHVLSYLNRVTDIEPDTPYSLYREDESYQRTMCFVNGFAYIEGEDEETGETTLCLALSINELNSGNSRQREITIGLELVKSIKNLRKILASKSIGSS